jgi:hypothetical protein
MVDKNGVEWYTVGTGSRKRRRWRTSLENIEVIKRLSPPRAANSFEGKISPAEASSKRILERVGLPTDTKGHYTIPQGERIPMPTTEAESRAALSHPGVKAIGGLLSLIKARGFREREHQEWYAAEILSLAHAIRGTMANAIGQDGRLRQGVAWSVLSLAADLGELVGEAKEIGFSKSTGSKGGGKEKKIRPLFDWLRETVKQYPDKKTPFYWNSIPDYFEGDRPQPINGAEMIREGDYLVVICDDGRRPSITFSSFRKYVTDAKKSLKL